MSLGVSALNSISLDESTSSSDAADVLIRSTKVGLQQNRPKGQCEGIESTLCSCSKVNINVRRLSDSMNGCGLAKTSEHGFPEPQYPPVLHINMPSATYTGPEERDYRPSDQVCGVGRIYAAGAGEDTKKTSIIETRNNKQEGQDVLISRYSSHGRGAVVAALNQRSYRVPARREVKVQLLDKGPPQNSVLQVPEVQPNHAFPTGESGAATTVAAITSATIAATAPLIRAQSEMEARVAQVASELRRLQEAEGQANIASESRSLNGAQRVAQLQEQLTLLTQQRLQHLERIQSQQLELQNHLLFSALNIGTACTNPPLQSTSHLDAGTSASGSVQMPEFNRLPVADEWSSGDPECTDIQDQGRDISRRGTGSLLEVPAPRKVIPKPARWNRAQNTIQYSSTKTQKAAQKNCGNAQLQEQHSNNQRSTRHAAQSDRVKRVTIATVNDSQPEHSR